MAMVLRGLWLGAALAAAGCDKTGGLLVVKSNPPDAGPPVVVGPSVTELVSAGTVARSAKYKAVYTLGQATPNQGASKSAEHRDNGGLVGAMNGTPATADAP